jgi:Arc/MetJ-type ribon-helix-helix transcriptional regulator
MQISLHPETEQTIEELVKAGRFPTREAVIEAAVAELKEADSQLDDATIDAINEAEDQGDRGEGIDLDAFRAQMEKRISSR